MNKPPKPPPHLVAQMDSLHAACNELLDRYVNGFSIDMNRHAVKHGPMDPAEAHWHLAKILAREFREDQNMLAGITAAAIQRGIAGKAKGKG